ncbi:MAG: serine/threonine protein kinase [Ignavibacteria bacterium]
MQQMLKNKQIVKTVISAQQCIIEDYIGGGGQGEVYKVNLNGTKQAVKWYLPNTATEAQRKNLDILIKRGTPNDKFLWPQDLVTCDNNEGYGYIMPLRDERYKSIIDLMKRRIDPTFYSLITACYQLTDSFLQLHSKGYSYRDISFGNLFFDPENGDILICDNDNAGYDQQTDCGVLGTPSFMAPEIVRGEAKPGASTDLYSLAVLLFYMLMISHPLDGKREASIKCLDLPARNKLYGTEPLFIFDPGDDSNRPVPGLHDNADIYWKIYPQEIKDLFTKAFTDGLKDPLNGRVRESQWRQSMIKLRDSIIKCGDCGQENFYDPSILKAGHEYKCCHCKRTILVPPKIRISNSTIVLNSDTKLFPHHAENDWDFSKTIAEVTRHPRHPDIWGLKNTSDQKWILQKPDGTQNEVEPNKSAGIITGNKINFGKAEGEILA